MNRSIKYIRQRLKWLNETSDELRAHYVRTNDELIHDLYLEIDCYTEQIEFELKRMEKENE